VRDEHAGDVDAIVPIVGTRRWIATLKMDIIKAWRPWFVGQQVSGYVEVYDGLTLATVRDAGHMVPYTQPARALHLFESFIFGLEL
jgi:serine carboxypeptidase-like clade 2